VTSRSVREKNPESHRASHRKDMSPLTQGLNYRSACDYLLLSKMADTVAITVAATTIIVVQKSVGLLIGSFAYTQYTPPTPTRLSCRVASRRRCVHEFATSSRRLPTDSVDNVETDCWYSIAVWLPEFWSTLMTVSTMTSLCRHSTGNCELGHDCRRRDSTVELSRVGVGCVYWALISAHLCMYTTLCVRYSHGKCRGRCGGQENASVLSVRRHRQHRITHAESRLGQKPSQYLLSQ